MKAFKERLTGPSVRSYYIILCITELKFVLAVGSMHLWELRGPSLHWTTVKYLYHSYVLP